MSVRKDHRVRADGSVPWIVDYKDAQGDRRHKTFKSHKEAKDWDARTRVQVQEGTHVADRATVTVEEAGKLWIQTCKANGLERTTIEAYEGHLKYHINPAIGHVLLSKVTVPFMREFEDTLRQGERSPAMIKRVVGSVGSLLADSQERGLVVHNAVRDMRSQRKGKQRRQEQRHKEPIKAGKDYPTPDEMRAFLGVLTGRWRVLFLTAVFCGPRSSELRGLRWPNVDLSEREIDVQERADRFDEMGPPKSKNGRRKLPIPAGLAQELREWKLVCPKVATEQRDASGNPVMALDRVFPNGRGNGESHGNIINRGLIPAMIAAGITVDTGKRDKDGKPILAAKYTGLHALRHFYASWCINPISRGGMGLSPKEVQMRMGHASIAMTLDTYGHLFPKGDTTSEVDAAERALLG